MEKPKCKLCGERHWGICPVARAEASKIMARHEDDIFMVALADSSSAAKQPKRKAKSRNPKSAAIASHQPRQLTPEEITDIKARRAEANASAKAVVQAAGVIADPRLPVMDQLAPPEKFDRIAYQREYMRKRREAVRLTKPLD